MVKSMKGQSGLKTSNHPEISSTSETLDSKRDAIIYFVGCTPAYRRQEIAKSTARIFQKLGVDFKLLPDEVCCGSP